MVNTLSDVEGNILDCKTAIEEFDNELLQLHWDVFDRIQGQFKDLDSELSNLRDLFKDSKVTDGGSGWSREGVAQLGLLAQQYEVTQRQIQQYNDAISRLNDDYKSGKYSATEYMDKLSDLTAGQWDAVKSSEAVKDAIMELNEARIDEEISAIEKETDAYRELVNAQIEALKSAEDLHNYQRQIAEKTKSVTELERQIAATRNDDSAATVAKRKQLEAQLAEARKALEEAEYQHSIEEQENALNKEFENYETERNAEIEKLRASLEEKEQLIAASFEMVKQNAAIVGQEIAAIAAEHGIRISDTIVTAWQNGENSIASYGTVLTENSSAFIGNLMGVENEVYNLQSQANVTAESLSYMFASRADGLVNELANSYYAEENLNNMTRALNDSLVKTLESGYNISSLTNAIGSIIDGVNGIASAARNATQALSEMGAARQNANSGDGSGKGSSGKGSGSGGGNGGSGDWHTNQYVRFAKGGIVKKDKDDPLNPIAESMGEDRMVAVKEGEGVFTKEQTGLLKKMVTENDGETRGDGGLGASGDTFTVGGREFSNAELKAAGPSFFWNANPSYPAQAVRQPDTVPNNVNNRNSEVHVGSLITVQGNIDSSNVKQMEAIADKAVGKFARELNNLTRFGRV